MMDLAELRVFVGAEFVPSTRILQYGFVVGLGHLRGLFQPEWFCSVIMGSHWSVFNGAMKKHGLGKEWMFFLVLL